MMTSRERLERANALRTEAAKMLTEGKRLIVGAGTLLGRAEAILGDLDERMPLPPPSPAEGVCSAAKPFVLLNDPTDVVWLTCDRKAGHGGNGPKATPLHHDPERSADWYA